MIDWTQGMSQTFSYFIVDPVSWLDVQQLTEVTSCKIIYDLDSELLYSASFTIDNRDFAEEYIRVYMECQQGDERERVPLGTFLCQTPKRKGSGNVMSLSVAAYSPFIEYQGAEPPFGAPIGGQAYQAFRSITDRFHPPVVGTCEGESPITVTGDGESWIQPMRRALAPVGCECVPDMYGRTSIRPVIPTKALQPVWTFTDDNSSIMLPSYDETFDWYKLPNVCRLTWSEPTRYISAVAVNDDPSSQVSTVSRGREVTLTINNPEELHVGCTQQEADIVAKMKLEEASTVEVTYVISHGYCPVQVGDAIRIRYNRFGIDVVAKVTNQELNCVTGAEVRTTAKSVMTMWSAR